MAKTSVIVPARNERYLCKTVENIFARAAGEIEVIVVIDGPTEFELPDERDGLTIIYKPEPEGMRCAINNGAAWASGKYLMKLDAHCTVGEAFDAILQADCDDDWIVSARRYDLDAETGKLGDHAPVDYFYLSCPWTNTKHFIMQSCPWVSRTQRRQDIMLDEQMTIHGAMWFMHADYFYYRLNGMDSRAYGGFAGEPLELGMKTWLSGGKMMVNKRTWYAHSRAGPNYSVRSTRMMEGLIYAAHYWVDNCRDKRQHDFAWFIDRFWPLPTERTLVHGEKYYWPEDWKGYLVQHT